MQKSILIAGFFFLLIGKIVAQSSGEKKGWPSSERYSFISECVKTASEGMSADSARFYCYCMQFKVEARYPSIDDAAKLTSDDMESQEWQKEIKSCASGGTWSAKDRSGFLEECINSVKAGVGEEKAKVYCECMLYKVEVRYTNAADAGKLTSEKLNTPEWKKIIESCMSF